jgi:S-adenosylmethionine hydrolase
MPQDAVFVAVVDPGVGSPRRAVAIETGSGAMLVGPDNGVLSMAWLELGDIARASEIRSDDVLLQPVSKTFHGRDVFAPAAAHFAVGFAFEDLGPAVLPATLETVELPGPMVTPGKVGARVVAVDGFGNVQLNAKPVDLERAGLADRLAVGGKSVPRVGSFADIRDHALGMIVDSQGFLAFMVNRGKAADALNLAPGDPVVIESD